MNSVWRAFLSSRPMTAAPMSPTYFTFPASSSFSGLAGAAAGVGGAAGFTVFSAATGAGCAACVAGAGFCPPDPFCADAPQPIGGSRQ